MNFKRYYQQALVNLMSSKLRSLLAVLGILVGTAAVVALLSCGQLATEKALQQFKALGTDLLSVNVYMKEGDSGLSGKNQIYLDEWRQLPEKIPAIKKIAPYATAYQTISYEGHSLKGAIVGGDESLADILHIQLSRGNFVSFVDSYEHYCVIGSALAEQIKQISLEDPLGKQVRIGQVIYTIIGIASPWPENSFFNEDINNTIIIPIAGMAVVNKDAKVDNAVLSIRENKHIDRIVEQLKAKLEQQAPKLGIFIRSARQIIDSMESQGKIFTILLAVIGGISLLVGGIGIMNVMLVSVSERKKEIGIRKAIGAKNQEIQHLFLMESLILSLLGGFMGVGLGLMVTWVIAYFNQWPFAFFAVPPLAGFAVSVTTGIFFGYYPARRAAALEPIESLREGL